MVNPETGTPTANPEEGAVVDEQSAVDLVNRMLQPEGPSDEGAQETPEANPDGPETDSQEAVEAEVEPKAASEAEEAESEPEDVVIPDTLSGLATALEVEPDELANHIKVPIKVNGEDRLVTIAEAVKGQQLESDYRQKTSELAEQRKAFEANTERQQTEWQSKVQQVEDLAVLLAARLQHPSDEDLNKILEDQGSEAYLVAKSRVDAAREADKEALGKVQAQRDQQVREQQQNLMEHRAKQQQLLASAIPDFADPQKTAAIEKEMSSYLSGHGFTEEEVKQFYSGPFDHRQVKIIHEAMQWRALQAQKSKITKTIKKAPKMVKPGPSQNYRTPNQGQALRDRLRKAGSKRWNKKEQTAIAVELVKEKL